MNALHPLHVALSRAVGIAVMPVTRTVARCYPDSSIDFRGIALQMGERPTLVVRYIVTHADESATLVRLEDGVWVVTDEDQIPRTGAALASLVAVLA